MVHSFINRLFTSLFPFVSYIQELEEENEMLNQELSKLRIQHQKTLERVSSFFYSTIFLYSYLFVIKSQIVVVVSQKVIMVLWGPCGLKVTGRIDGVSS